MHEINEHLTYLAGDVMLEETSDTVVKDTLASNIGDIEAQDAETISRNVETLTTAHDSFESYITNFFKTVDSDNWSARTGRQFELGLEALAQAAGVSLEALGFEPSFEDVGKTETPAEHRTSSEEKSKGIVARIWEAIKRAFERVYNFFKDLFDRSKRAERWLYKASDTVSAKLIRARQSGGFKTGAIEKTPGWSKYLVIDGSYSPASNSLEVAAARIFEVASAFSADAADAADMEVHLTRVDMKDGKLGFNIPAENLKKIAWPVKLPGNTELTISGDTKDFTKVTLNKLSGQVTSTKHEYLTEAESTRFIKAFRELAETATKVNDGFYRHAREFEQVRKALREKGEGKQSFISDLTKILAHHNSAVRLLVLELHQIAKMGYDHAIASVK